MRRRVLMGTPRPRAATEAAPLQYPVAAGFGALFDALNVKPTHLRTWADLWLARSETRLLMLAQLTAP